MTDLLWTVENVTLAGDRRPRLESVSVEIAAGSTAVVGYSGAGKTSLLNLLTQFERPDHGRVTLHAVENDGRLPLFWVPPTDGLWPHLSAEAHLCTVMPDAGSAGARCAELLDAFDLTARRYARPGELSQGERSRLAVARALASDAAILVMDEPLMHVDAARLGRYWDAVRNHCRHRNSSLVLATHSAETVLREAQRAVCLHEGRVLFTGDVQDLYYRPHNPQLAAFLGPANWLNAVEVRDWLGENADGDCCYRPEQIAIHPAPVQPAASGGGWGRPKGAPRLDDSGGCVSLQPQPPPFEEGVRVTSESGASAQSLDAPYGFVVVSARFAGSVEEVELRNKHSGQFKTFYHRPPRPMLAAGQKAFIKLLLALWLCYLVAGCTPDTAPHLPVKAVRYWSVPPQGASIPAPRALTISADGEVYVLDDGGRVLVFDGEGKLKRQWDMPESDVGNPEGICLFKDGRVAVADTHYHRVMFFDRDGEVLGMLGSLGKEPGQFIYPVAIVQDNTENFYVAEYGDNDRIQKFSVDGSVLLEFGSFGTETGQFQRPSGIVWRDGKIYAVDAFNNRIQVFSDSGEFLQILGDSDQSASLHYPYDISVTADGSLYVIEYGAGRVSKFDLQGRLLGRYGTTGRGDSQFVTPWGLTVDSQSRVLVADTGNRRIVELDQ